MTNNVSNSGRRSYSAALFILLALIPLCFGSLLVLLYIFNKNPKEKNNKPEREPQPGSDLKYNGNGSGVFEKFAISSEHPECSKAGIKMMKLGGNAVDAAIAALLCIGVVNNFSSGIGGGGFMVVKKSKSKINSTEDGGVVIDFRETAPVNATEDMFIGKPNDATEGGKSVAIPGELRGFELAKNRFPSKLSWKELFSPAIELAEHGFPVNRRLKYLVERYKDVINRHAPLKRLYMDERGSHFQSGQY